jgi:hypothetical protein
LRSQKRVEPVSKIAGDLGHPTDLRLEVRSFFLAFLVEAANQVLGDISVREAVV